MTASHPDASANAPCTSTTAGNACALDVRVCADARAASTIVASYVAIVAPQMTGATIANPANPDNLIRTSAHRARTATAEEVQIPRLAALARGEEISSPTRSDPAVS